MPPQMTRDGLVFIVPVARDQSELLEGLTTSQREAVLATNGPVLVLAGPGSGKTRVITRRIAYLMSLGVPGWKILAVTFTNKAAGEMGERVRTLLGEPAPTEDNPRRPTNGPTITTFHSLCVRLLRRYAESGGLVAKGLMKPAFTVFDADDQARLAKTAIATLQLSTANFPPRTVLNAISEAKNELVDAEEFGKRASDFHARTIARVYKEYQKSLIAAGGVDFDDLLMLTARMLRESAAVRAAVQDRYRYLLIDEYQDTNRAQFLIASLIAGGASTGPSVVSSKDAATKAAPSTQPNICVVGDPDQSIYGWRGADLRNILQFEEQYPGAKVIRLGENFRSRASILAAADRLIKHNTQRKHKPLVGMRGEGDPVEVTLCRDEHHEARIVVDWLKVQRAAGGGQGGRSPDGALAWRDCAVFYRTNALSRVIEDHLRREGIPYVMVRGTAFYQREEVKNALAYLRLVANPADSVSLERVVNTPARGISDATVERLTMEAQARGAVAMDVLREVGAGHDLAGMQPRARASVAKFVAMLDGWTSFAATEDKGLLSGQIPPLAELVERVVRESGLEKMYAEEEERRENLAELVSSAREFAETGAPEDVEPDPESDAPVGAPPTTIGLLRSYLERVALVADTDAIQSGGAGGGAVTLMTLHAAKGLEYPLVAMIGLEEGMLPHIRSAASDDALEEERRLAFVGITRSMERLLITSAKFRTIRGLSERTITSRFVDELRGDHVTISDQSDPFGDAPGDERMRTFVGGGGGGGGGSREVKPGGAGAGGGDEWSPGTAVRHPQFGTGVVQQFWGGQGARVQVKFQQAGVKTLMLEYARLTKLKTDN